MTTLITRLMPAPLLLFLAVLLGTACTINIGSPDEPAEAPQSEATAAPTQARERPTMPPASPGPTQQAPPEFRALANADWLEQSDRTTFQALETLPWIQDGLSHAEARAAQNLLYTAVNDGQTLQLLLGLQWTTDAITPPEAKAIEAMMHMSKRDKTISRAVLAMPFLESVEEADALLIQGLNGLHHRNALDPFLAHSTIADGIADHEVVKALAATTLTDDVQLARVLLPGNATVETIQTATNRTPDLSISIVRAGDHRPTESTLVIEESVRYVENFMDAPLPTNHIVVLLDDGAIIDGFSGVNYGQAIAYTRQGEDGSDREKLYFTLGMTHEIAHYFWRGSEDWLDEGMANTIEHTFGRMLNMTPSLLRTNQEGCTTTSLQALIQIDPASHQPEFLCNYYLGERLFKDLQDSMGEQPFKAAAQELYQLTLTARGNEITAGIEEVSQAFDSKTDLVHTHWAGSPPVTARTGNPQPRSRPETTEGPTTPAQAPTLVPIPVSAINLAPTETPGTPAPTRPPRRIWPTATPTPTPGPPVTPTPTPTPRPTQTPTPHADSEPYAHAHGHARAATHPHALRQLRMARIHDPIPARLGRNPRRGPHHFHRPGGRPSHGNRPPPRPARFIPGRIRRPIQERVLPPGQILAPLRGNIGPRRVHPRRQRHNRHVHKEERRRQLQRGRNHLPAAVQLLPREEHGLLHNHDHLPRRPDQMGTAPRPDPRQLQGTAAPGITPCKPAPATMEVSLPPKP